MKRSGALDGLRLLVVEDEYFIAVDTIDKLEAEGAIIVGPAATVEDALALLAEGAPDGAVLDLNLAGDKSFTVADALMAQGVPLVFVTSYGAEAIPGRYASVQRCGKPIDIVAVANGLLKSRHPGPQVRPNRSDRPGPSTGSAR